MSFRTYRDVSGPDRSELAGQVAEQRARVQRRLSQVRHVVAIASGKGGVGKSWVTAQLARALAPRLDGGVGVVDADLKSPTVARMLECRGPLSVTAEGVIPALAGSGVRLISTELLLDQGQPLRWNEHGGERFVWRGTLETGALREFLSDVAWGPLDILLVDLPPGSEKLPDLAELVPGLSGAVMVTLPSEESGSSVERTMHAAREARVRILGVIENMSGYRCPDCGNTHPLFTGSAGALLAEKFGVPLLGRIPFSPPPSQPAAPAIQEILSHLLRTLS